MEGDFFMLKTNSKTHFIVCIAILGALSGVLMLLEFPLPIAPPFYKVDLSDVAALIGGFGLGPMAGVLICLVKVLISIVLDGTKTAFVGEFAAFLMDGTFVFVSSLIYQKKHDKKGAIISLLCGVIALTLMGMVANYYLMVPAYVKFMNFPLEAIISMGSAINANVNSLWTLILFCTAPFNLVKGLIISVLTFDLYKRVSPLLK